MKEILLVRHGQYESSNGRLTPTGEAQAIRAQQDLLARNLGKDAVILSSDLPRAVETSEIISGGLKIPFDISGRFQLGSNNPLYVNSLHAFLKKCAEGFGIDWEKSSTLIAVGHAPLIAKVCGLESAGDVDYAGIYDVTAIDWQNTDYNAEIAESILRDIR